MGSFRRRSPFFFVAVILLLMLLSLAAELIHNRVKVLSLMYKDRGTCCRNIIYILAPTLFDPYVTLLCI
jgi:hypothetical protein